jgi:hypothetical protein
MNEVTFSVNNYDNEGDISQLGIYLHFGETRIRVAENLTDFKKFQNELDATYKEIKENYYFGSYNDDWRIKK